MHNRRIERVESSMEELGMPNIDRNNFEDMQER